MTSIKNRTTRTRSSGRLAASLHATPRADRSARTSFALVLAALIAALAAFTAAVPAMALDAASGPGTPGTVTPGAGPNTATFGVQPATGDKPDSRARLTYSATPGARITDHVAIQNYSTKPLQLHVYANDAFNTNDGGFDIQAASVSPKDVGSWVHLSGPVFVTVPARSFAIVPVTIQIPVNATPGDHAGGLVAGLNRIATDPKGNRVNVEERVGTRVYIRVPGKLSAALTLTNVRTTYHTSWNPFGAGSATVSYTVRNTGNVRLAGDVNVKVTSFVGGSQQAANVPGAAINVPNVKELLPGQQISYSSQVGGVLPSFVVSGRVTVDPSALPGDIDPKASSVSTTASAAAVPWAQLILLVLLLGLAFVLVRRRRRPVAPAGPGAGAVPPRAAAAGSARKAAAKAGSAGVKTGG